MTKGYYLFIRDKTTCGGIIAEGEPRHTIMRKAVARELDRVTCGKLPSLFKKLGPIHERAMKALVIEGIIKLTGYSNAQRSYRAYAISKRCLRRFFGTDREA